MRGSEQIGSRGRLFGGAALIVFVLLAVNLGPAFLGGRPLVPASALSPDDAATGVPVLPPTAGGISVLKTASTSVSLTVPGNVTYLGVDAPDALVFDALDDALFVGGGTAFLAKVNASSYAPSLVIPAAGPTAPGGLVVSPATGDIYALVPSLDLVTVLDGNGSIVSNISVGTDPIAAAYDPASHTVVVLNGGAGTVSIIGSSNTVTSSVAVGAQPDAVAYDPADSDLYIANGGSGNVSILGSTGKLTATVAAGGDPGAVNFSASSDEIYVANDGSDNLTAISGSSVAASIPTLGGPDAIAYDPGSGDLDVTDGGAASVTVVSPGNAVVASVPVGTDPVALGYNPSSQLMFVGNAGSENVSILSVGNGVAGQSYLGADGTALAYDPVSEQVALVGPDFDGVLAISGSFGPVLAEPTDPQPAFSPIAGAAYSPTTGEIYFPSAGSDYLDGYTATHGYGADLYLGAYASPRAIAYSPDTHDMYVADAGSSNVSIVTSSDELLKNLHVGTNPEDVLYSPETEDIYVVNSGSANVSVIGPGNTLVATIAVGSVASVLGYSPQSDDVYCLDTGAAEVSVIGSSNTVVATVPVGSGPDGFAYSPASESVYIANAATDNVTVLLPNNHVSGAGIGVGGSPGPMTYSAATNDVYVVNKGTNNVTPILASGSAGRGIPAGTGPVAITYDVGLDDIIVSNSGSSNATIIGASNRVVGNLSTYANPGFLMVDPGDLELWIADASTPYAYINVFGFTDFAGYFFTAPENSIYSGTTHDVYVTDLYTSTVTVLAPDGQLVAQVPVGIYPDGLAYSPVTGDVYVLTGYDANVTVIGSDNRVVTVIQPPSGDLYSVAFNPGSGDVYLTSWESGQVFVVDSSNAITATLDIGGRPFDPTYDPANSDLLILNDEGNNITAIGPDNTVAAVISGLDYEPYSNGEQQMVYSPVTKDMYVVGGYQEDLLVIDAANAYVGEVSDGVTLPIAVTYSPVTQEIYALNYRGFESLPDNITIAGASNKVVGNLSAGAGDWIEYWPGARSIAVGGAQNVDLFGATNTLVANLSVGSYPELGAYSNASGDEFVPNDGSGTVSIIGQSFAVTVHETGLAAGTGWTATVDGFPATSTTSNLTWWQGNGSYRFSVAAAGALVGSPGTGSITVDGAATTQNVSFGLPTRPTYNVTFTTTGVPTGARWNVTLNGSAETATGTSVTFVVPNGTYPFTVVPPTGTTANRSTGSVVVSGKPVNEAIAFTPGSSGGTPGGSTTPSSVPLWAWLVGALVALAVVVGLVFLLRGRRTPPAPGAPPSSVAPDPMPPPAAAPPPVAAPPPTPVGPPPGASGPPPGAV